MKKILCWLGIHDWEVYSDALDWVTEKPSPYMQCWRCEKLETVKKGTA